MELYQNVLSHLAGLVNNVPMRKEYPFNAEKVCMETDRSEMIMKRSLAYELGGSGNSSANCTIVATQTDRIFSGSKVIVIGRDLSEIHKDTSYGKGFGRRF